MLAVVLVITLYILLPYLLAPKPLFPGPNSHWLTGTPRTSTQACYQHEEWSQQYGPLISPDLVQE